MDSSRCCLFCRLLQFELCVICTLDTRKRIFKAKAAVMWTARTLVSSYHHIVIRADIHIHCINVYFLSHAYSSNLFCGGIVPLYLLPD